MSDFIIFKVPIMQHEAVQSLLEARKQARSLENTIEALLPIVANEEFVKQLEECREAAAKTAGIFQRMYQRNARGAFEQGPVKTPQDVLRSEA